MLLRCTNFNKTFLIRVSEREKLRSRCITRALQSTRISAHHLVENEREREAAIAPVARSSLSRACVRNSLSLSQEAYNPLPDRIFLLSGILPRGIYWCSFLFFPCYFCSSRNRKRRRERYSPAVARARIRHASLVCLSFIFLYNTRTYIRVWHDYKSRSKRPQRMRDAFEDLFLLPRLDHQAQARWNYLKLFFASRIFDNDDELMHSPAQVGEQFRWVMRTF